ncbi:4'-phosphopantetheinyl transferase family protein [Microbacterium radiodurans]|uniref:4'-phosphopantetheinyl transferase superfamily protein n=1 Tax=Microbacterium radiodurans TaxID=661398 RepID=A0A5J5ISL1_9MICO|nr:hypothetical protein [Microbacterium radiodurans]KAA9085344.1 hypothetical protein F6B42_12810 [Microbacterium radiodurans]
MLSADPDAMRSSDARDWCRLILEPEPQEPQRSDRRIAVDVGWRRTGGDRRIAADEALRASLSRQGADAAGIRFSRVCGWCGGDHGAVRAAGWPGAVSVTYAAGWAIVATTADLEGGAAGRAGGGSGFGAGFAIDAAPANLDAAAVRRIRDALHDDRADTTTWTRVEAALKADGRGLRVDPATVRLSTRGGCVFAEVPAPAASTGPAAGSGPAPRRYAVHPLPGPADVVVSVAVAAPEAPARRATG